MFLKRFATFPKLVSQFHFRFYNTYLCKRTIQCQEKNIDVFSNNNEITPQIFEKVLDSVIFKDWFDSLVDYININNRLNKLNKQNEFRVNHINIQSVDMFGSRVGFIKLSANVTNEEGVEIPGITFLRGGAVAILMILKCEDKEYCLLVKQPRVPIGNFGFYEIPAGMLDGEGKFSGKAAQEIEEETSIKVTDEDLVDLTSIYEPKDHGVYTSPGGMDEFIKLFLYKTEVSKEFLNNLNDKFTGLREEGEFISLRIVPLEEAYKITPDAKLLSALYLYEKFMSKLNKQ